MISLTDLKRRIDKNELSPDAALSQSLEAIDAYDKTVGAFVCRRKAPRAASEGPLRGIAVGIKDLIDTSELPTEMGSPIYKEFQPRADRRRAIQLSMDPNGNSMCQRSSNHCQGPIAGRCTGHRALRRGRNGAVGRALC